MDLGDGIGTDVFPVRIRYGPLVRCLSGVVPGNPTANRAASFRGFDPVSLVIHADRPLRLRLTSVLRLSEDVEDGEGGPTGTGVEAGLATCLAGWARRDRNRWVSIQPRNGI